MFHWHGTSSESVQTRNGSAMEIGRFHAKGIVTEYSGPGGVIGGRGGVLWWWCDGMMWVLGGVLSFGRDFGFRERFW